MTRTMMKSKIHRATVTDADLNYVGSITIDRGLMEAADLLEFEQVHVVNINNGARFETYVIEGDPDSGWKLIHWDGSPIGGLALADPTAEDPTGMDSAVP